MAWIKKALIPISFVAVVVINALANALPINGITTGGVSDSYPNLFAPAGLTFSIWGLIYILLAGYVLYYSGLFRKKKSLAAEKISTLFIITCVANIAWLFSWHYNLIWLSVLFMIVLLVTLILIATKLRRLKLSIREKFFVRLPFSIYFGWITVATIANITTFFVSIGWNGFALSDVFWTVLILIVGAIIGLWRAFLDKDIAYLLVFVWAYLGILNKHLNEFAGQYEGVITTLIICLIIFFLGALYLSYIECIKTKKKTKKKKIKKRKRKN